MDSNIGDVKLSYSQRFSNYLGEKVTYGTLVWIFLIINMLNYIERSIIPGSSIEMEEFVSKTIHDSPDTFLGLLQSAFIFGFSVACIIFGYCVSLKSPFFVVVIGLIVWFAASILSGIAWNYWILLIARLFSGVGEAAFQIVVPAFIDDYSPKTLVGTAMSRLYMAIPVGTALGYAISGFVAEHFSWRIMYLATAPLMLPFIFIIYYYPLECLEGLKEPNESLCSDTDQEVDPTEKQVDSQTIPKEEKYPIMKAVFKMLITPTFILAVLGEAIAVFISTGFTSFGTIFLKNLHMFETETVSALVVGCLGCLAGMIGAMFGGYSLDFLMKLRDSYTSLYNYYTHLFIFSLIAVSCCITAAFSISNRYLFLLFVFLGCIAIFAANPSWTLVILTTAPSLIRSLAVGIATILYHVFGDVPAPILIGKLIDVWLKRAGEDEEKRYIAYYQVLQIVMFFSILLVLFWSIGYFIVFKKEKQKVEVRLERQSVLEDNCTIIAVTNATDHVIVDIEESIESGESPTPITPSLEGMMDSQTSEIINDLQASTMSEGIDLTISLKSENEMQMIPSTLDIVDEEEVMQSVQSDQLDQSIQSLQSVEEVTSSTNTPESQSQI